MPLSRQAPRTAPPSPRGMAAGCPPSPRIVANPENRRGTGCSTDAQRVGLLGRLDDAERPVADLLIAHGKRVPAWMLPRACRPDVSSNEVHRVNVLLDYGASVDDRGRYGLTALHYAVRGGKLPLIKLLLERGAQADALDENGLTPLLHLAKTRSKADPVPVMELLVAGGADVNARDETQGTL